MKKIKTINKLLSSLTLLSQLSGIGFNNQYQNTQKVITENSNNSLNNYIASQTNAQREMGDITVYVYGTRITGYVSGTGDLVVDSDITEIAATSFRNNENITSLDLSNATSLTTIGDYAFQSCSNLTGDLVIPQNLTSISKSAFRGVTKFTSITVDPLNKNFSLATNLGPKAKVLISGTDGIWNNNSIASIALGDITIPSSVTSIEIGAFSYTGISSLDLSQATSLTSIGDEAFASCKNLTGDLVIPSSVTTIDYRGFSHTEFTSLDLSNATNLTTIGTSAFFSIDITYLDLSQATSLTTIGDSAFGYCLNLSGNLVIPSSVTSIGDSAFSQIGITSLDLSNAISLTTIGESAFASCENLAGNLVIPQNLTSISKNAFPYVTKFTSITVDPLNKNFSWATNLGPKAKVLISDTNDGIWNNNSITSIAWGNVVIPSNVTKIQSNAFSLTSISSLDFSQATSLTTIGDEAFDQTKITSLDLSQATSLTTIGDYAFSYCDVITEDLTIPSSVTNIGYYAFKNNTIDNLYFLSETPPISFASDWQPIVTGKVYVPEGTKDVYVSAQNFGFTEGQIEVIGVSGKVLINVDEKSAGSEQYTTIAGFSATKWEIVMTKEGVIQPEWLSIDNQGILSWTDQCAVGTYKFKIKATNDLQASVESAPITFVVNESIKPEPTPEKSKIPLILGILIGLGIPVILAIAFIIWHLTKKKKTTVKI